MPRPSLRLPAIQPLSVVHCATTGLQPAIRPRRRVESSRVRLQRRRQMPCAHAVSSLYLCASLKSLSLGRVSAADHDDGDDDDRQRSPSLPSPSGQASRQMKHQGP